MLTNGHKVLLINLSYQTNVSITINTTFYCRDPKPNFIFPITKLTSNLKHVFNKVLLLKFRTQYYLKHLRSR